VNKYYSHIVLSLIIIWLFMTAHSAHAGNDISVAQNISQAIDKANRSLERNLLEGNLTTVIELYADNAILMPEYQPTLNGVDKIRSYFETLDDRRKIVNLSSQSEEMIGLGKYVIDIGSFKTNIEWLNDQDVEPKSYSGKYWRIWNIETETQLKLVGEAFGFYKNIENPQQWVTDMNTWHDASPTGFKASDASLELKAYHALGREGVQHKNGDLRSSLYAPDAIFYPFANTPKKGIEVLKPYLIEYSSNSAYIDSVQTHTHDVIYFDNYLLEFTKFAVAWTYEETTDQANGKGIKIRKRMDNGELLIYRTIGMHNFSG